MDKIKAMRVFVEVVEVGSLTGAANKLDISRSMATRYIASLEKSFSVKLLNRHSRNLNISNAGEELLPYCQKILALNDEATFISTNEDAEPKGVIRIACSVSFGQSYLAKATRQFLKLYPKVSVELILTERNVDLSKESFDIFIQIGNHCNPNMVARKLTSCYSVVCASPHYIKKKGQPTTPRQLTLHNCLKHIGLGQHWLFKTHTQKAEQEPIDIPITGHFSSNDVMVLLQAAIEAEGITCLPSIIVQPYLDRGELIPLLERYITSEIDIHIVYPTRKHLTNRVHRLIDFLIDDLNQVQKPSTLRADD